MLAVADFLDDPSTEPAASLLSKLLPDGLQELVYMGFSFGGASAAGAAFIDDRASGSINLDGSIRTPELLGAAARVPHMEMIQNANLRPFYKNEFYFEPLDTMGTNNDVIRMQMPKNHTHADFNDLVHFDQGIRSQFLGLPNPVDGENIFNIVSHFCLSFLGSVLDSDDTLDPAGSFALFDDIASIDVSYVADWANARNNTDCSTDSDDGPVTSGATGCLYSWLFPVFVTIVFGSLLAA